MRYDTLITVHDDGKGGNTVLDICPWNEADYDDVTARMRVLAFDLDNTLACSRQPMSEAMAARIAALSTVVDLAIVTGGRYELVVSQILSMLGDDADLSRLHLMPTSGTRYYRWDGAAWVCVYARELSEDDKRLAFDSLRRHAEEQGAWASQVWGARFEDRGSQLTFSALGQQAPLDAKEQWDPDDTRKRRLAAAVAADLPHLLVRPGGYTSIDVSAPGTDKAYAVRELAAMLGTTTDRIVFVGDRMSPGGNDYPAAQAGAIALRVSGPDDTLRLCDELLRRLDRR